MAKGQQRSNKEKKKPKQDKSKKSAPAQTTTQSLFHKVDSGKDGRGAKK